MEISNVKTFYYKHGNYKYRLTRDTVQQTNIFGQNIITDFIELYEDGRLLIKKGYAWDGCSGPTIDTKKNMRAGLVHDALYQLIRLGHLPASDKKKIDILFRDILKEDGFYASGLYYAGVSLFGGFAIKPKEEPKEESAP